MPTTIKLQDGTKDSLEDAQLPGETFDDTVSRLLGDTKGQAWTEEEIRQIASDEIEKMSRRNNRL